MTDLSHRAEQATLDEEGGLLEELFIAVRGHPAVYEYRQPDGQFGTTFIRLLWIDTPEAHLAAAMMLVDPHHDWLINSRCNYAIVWEKEYAGDATWECKHAATPALALIAVIARSLE